MTAVPFADGIPDPLTPRERAIRAIHNYADYLTAHPEVPTPRAVSGYAFLGHEEIAEEAERVAAVLRWAEASGLTPHENLQTVSATVNVVERDGISIMHTFGAYLDHEPRRRYLDGGEGNA